MINTSITKSKYFNIFISLLLIVTILFNFSIKPKAEAFIISSLAIKVFATILASMGILTIVNENIGLETFYNNFINYVINVKGIMNVVELLGNYGLNAITNKVKMNVSTIVKFINDYIKTIKLDNPVESEFNLYNGLIGEVNFYKESTGRELSNLNEIVVYNLIGNYSLQLRFDYMYNALKPYVGIFYKDGSIRTTSVDLPYISSTTYNNDFKLQIKGQITKYDELVLQYGILNINSNQYKYGEEKINIPIILDLKNLPELGEQGEGQLTLPVPYGLTFPWAIGIDDLKGYIGDSIDRLIDAITDIPMPQWIQQLQDIPKPILDSLPVPDVIVDEEGIITNIDVPDIDPTIPDIKEQTGIISSILAWLLKFFEKLEELLKKLFLPSETFITDKVTGFQNNLNSKLPTPDTGFVNILKTLEGKPIPDGYYKGNKILDASYINNLAGNIKSWQRWFYYILIGLYGMNNGYKLIRGGNIISSGKESSKE